MQNHFINEMLKLSRKGKSIKMYPFASKYCYILCYHSDENDFSLTKEDNTRRWFGDELVIHELLFPIIIESIEIMEAA